MHTVIWIVNIVSALAVVGLVLLQHGKGADMGAAFGSGASGSLFGASGGSNFLSHSTAVAAAVFFLSTIGLAFFSQQAVAPSSVVANSQSMPETVAPAPASVPSGTPVPKVQDIPK